MSVSTECAAALLSFRYPRLYLIFERFLPCRLVERSGQFHLCPVSDNREVKQFWHSLHITIFHPWDFAPPANEAFPGQSDLVLVVVPILQSKGLYYVNDDDNNNSNIGKTHTSMIEIQRHYFCHLFGGFNIRALNFMGKNIPHQVSTGCFRPPLFCPQEVGT